MTKEGTLIDTSLVYEELVPLVRLEKDGTYNLADAVHLHDHLGGALPSVGDFLTTSYEDGFAFSIEIVARHLVQEPDTGNRYWCLIFKEVDGDDATRLAACLSRQGKRL